MRTAVYSHAQHRCAHYTCTASVRAHTIGQRCAVTCGQLGSCSEPVGNGDIHVHIQLQLHVHVHIQLHVHLTCGQLGSSEPVDNGESTRLYVYVYVHVGMYMYVYVFVLCLCCVCACVCYGTSEQVGNGSVWLARTRACT